MNCSQIKKLLSSFLDNELDSATFRFIEEHLKACPHCRECLQEFREIDDLVSGLPGIAPSPNFSRRVVEAAIGTSKTVEEKPVPFSSRLRFALERLSEKIFSLLPSGSRQPIQTLEEFGDYPPLSMSFIYFRLLEQPKQRKLI